MKLKLEHGLFIALMVGTAVAEAFAQYVQAGGPLPSVLHITAASALAAATALGLVSRSVKDELQKDEAAK